MATTRTERALTTVEIAERLAVYAYAAIERGDTEEAMRLLAELTDVTTTTTCSLVKDQRLSDRISKHARERVARVGVFRQAAS